MKTKKDLSDIDFEPGYYMSPPIKDMLNKAKYLVKHMDWDRVFIIDGEEGTGKSLLALQLGYYLDPTLSLDRVVFTGDDFTEAIRKAKKNQCIIFDEAFNGLSSTGALSQMNKFIVSKLMECRQKNLFLVIVLPTIFLLQKYAAIFRSRALFHVYATSKGVRGYYRVYNRQNKKLLYIKGLKLYSYSKPYIAKSHVFRGKYPIDEQAYREKKYKALILEEPKKKMSKRELIVPYVLKALKECGWSSRKIEKYLKEHGTPIDQRNILRLMPKNT